MFSGLHHQVRPKVVDFEKEHADLIDQYIKLFDSNDKKEGIEGVIGILQQYLDSRESDLVEDMYKGFRDFVGFFGVKIHPESEDFRIRREHFNKLITALRSDNTDELRRLLAPDERNRFRGEFTSRYADHLRAIRVARYRIAECNRDPVEQNGIELRRLDP